MPISGKIGENDRLELRLPKPLPWPELHRRIRPTLEYWLETEVHVYALAIAASVMLSFFPFLIVMASLCRHVLGWRAGAEAVYAAVDQYFPGELGDFVVHNLRVIVQERGALPFVSLVLLLFTANGIFIPLEVALNRVWGVTTNRSYWRNQVFSMVLIFGCGSLALLATLLTGMNPTVLRKMIGPAPGWITVPLALLLKLAAIPVVLAMLLLIYWKLPNRRISLRQVVPATVAAGLALQAMQYLNLLIWPLWRTKVRHEYGPFYYSVSILFWSFLAGMVILAGAEWSARRAREAERPSDAARQVSCSGAGPSAEPPPAAAEG